MVWRRGASDHVVVDLGRLGDADVDEPARGGPTTSQAHPARDDDGSPERPSRRHRGRLAVAAGVVVLLAFSSWGMSADLRDRNRAERLASAPGGVLSLADAPRVAWSAGTQSSATAFLPGLVVVQRDGALHALDAGTGVERWQVPMAAGAQCRVSSSARGGAAVVDPLVCWGGPDAPDQVTVVHADGTWARRSLGEGVAWAAGTSDGGLATARLVGPAPPTSQVHVTALDGGYSIDGRITQGQDAVVRLEDATTGALRWEHTLRFHPVTDVWSCVTVNQDRTGATPTLSASIRPPEVLTVGSLVEVYGCGVQGVFTADGAAVGEAGTSSSSIVEPYVDGGVLELGGSGQDGASALRGPHGTVTFGAQVLNPAATDGTPSDVVLAGVGPVSLRAYDAGGTQRWRSAQGYVDLLARAHGVAVMALLDGGAAGVDLRTGKQLWLDGTLTPGAPGPAEVPREAFTDGRTAALLVAAPLVRSEDGSTVSVDVSGGPTTLVGVDLATGAIRWRTPLPGFVDEVDAVEGHLVVTTQSGIPSAATGLGDPAAPAAGTVLVLR